MLKHIGRHGDRKVAILFREIPGEDHMCLVIYPETLPTHIHDSIMRTLESDVGQQATNLADALHRNLLPDGRVQLVALHQEGMMKKIPSSQVIVTPNTQSSIKLDELNKILKEMETGEEAVKKMQQLDASTGLVDPAVKREQEQAFKRQQLERQMQQSQQNQSPVAAAVDGALDDKTLAAQMLAQAQRMEQDGNSLIKEAARMKKEAQGLFPGVIPSDNTVAETVNAKPAAKTRTTKRAKAADANTVQ